MKMFDHRKHLSLPVQHSKSFLKFKTRNKQSILSVRWCLLTATLLAIWLTTGAVSAWASGVTIGAPGASSQITGRTPFSATATSNGLPITAMKVYLDNANPEIASYNGNGTSTLTVNTTYSIANGNHSLTVNAWDTGGTLYQSIVSFTVSSTGVVINAPGESAQVTNLVPFAATATSNGLAVTSMKVYLDFNSTPIGSYDGNGTSSLAVNATYSVANGGHTLIVNAWDTGGQIYQSAVDFTMASTGVVINSPAQNAQVSSPVAFNATATSNGAAITAMKSYLDFNNTPVGTYNGNGTSTLNAQDSYSMNDGAHTLIVNAWDTGGQIYQSAVNFNSGSSSGFINIPSNATTLNNLDDATNWTDCNCGGTSGAAAQHSDGTVSNPSTDGQSRDFFILNSSSPTSAINSWLWFSSFTNITTATNWVFDYYVSVDHPENATAIEFDGNQNGAGGNFVFGTECNYGANPSRNTVWRFWDNSHWNTTTLACPLTSSGHWYHVQMHFVVNSSTQYTVQEIKVTDVTTNTVVTNTNLGLTLSGTGSVDHGHSIDVQLDGKNNLSFNVYYDQITVSRW